MKIRMLGPVDVELDGQSLKLGGPKQRAVLSLLAINANATVSLERLIDGLWGEDPPATASKMVQQYVSQLRRLLPVEIVTHGQGYRLNVDPATVDALRFEELVERAAREADGTRAALVREAMALWQGPPLADLVEEPFAAGEARRLDELHLVAVELSIESELEAGRETEVIGRLQALVDEHPRRERLRGLLMLALYRAGRQAEALDAFRDARWTLVETLGIEPGPHLRRLQEAILRQDPELERVVPDEAWTRRETAQQVMTGAGRASRQRGELRAAERELAANVIDLQQLQEPRRGSGRGACPYMGLAPFDVDDAERFFGRERLVAELVARLPGTGLLGVVGPSGSGKSSAVRAGLLAALAQGALPGSEGWPRLVLRPGAQPMAALSRALEGDLPERLVLAVDQFEEVFTACRDVAERAAFLDALVAAARRNDERILVILALRADFYGACAAHRDLAELLGENHVLVGPMRADELAQAIEGPAAASGVAVEPALVARLVEETSGRPGGLPLLSTTLRELWEGRSGDTMTLAAYDRTGGVQGAVARLAETAYGRLAPEETVAARNILLRLADAGEAGPAVRRQVALDELDLDRSDAVRRALGVLTDSRLVTVGRDAVEVAHEALLREWPRLRGWLEDDAEARRLHRHITLAAREWEAAGRDPAELYRGARLASALDFAGEHEDALNHLEREFLDEARLVSERDAIRGRRLNRRLRGLLAAALVALAAAAVAGVVALDQRTDARREARVADAQRLGAQALTDDQADRAALLGLAGVELDDSPATRGNLLTTLLRNPPALLGVFPVIDDAEIYAVAVSPDGSRVAFGDAGGRVRVFSLPDRRLLGTYQINQVPFLAFSPDSQTLAVGGHDTQQHADAKVDLVDARTLKRRAQVALPRMPKTAELVVPNPVFTPDGREVLILQTGFGPEPQPSRLFRADAATGDLIGRPRPVALGAAIRLVPDGDRVLVPNAEQDVTYAFDTVLRPRGTEPAGGESGAAGADGRLLALGQGDGTIRLLDRETGRVDELTGGHDTTVSNVVFTPDGRTLVSADETGALTVWDVATRRVRERLHAHKDEIASLAVSPDGRSLFSSGNDNLAVHWDLSGERRLVRTVALRRPFDVFDPSPRGVDVSPDGRTLAVSQADGTVDLIDTGMLQRRAVLRAGEDSVLAVDFSSDGRLIATADAKGQIVLWDAATLAEERRLGGLENWTQALAFSPDGTRVAASSVIEGPERLRVWDVRTGELAARPIDVGAVAVTFSPDGKLLAHVNLEGPVEVRDAETMRMVSRPETGTFPRSVAFSPDGRLLFIGRQDGSGQFFSTSDWQPTGAAIGGQDSRLTTALFTRDGRTLVTSSADGTVLLWDVASRKPIGRPVPVETDAFVSAALSHDDEHLFAMPTGRAGLRLTLSPAAWNRHACTVAGRELSEREWRDAVPRQPRRALCE